MALPPDTSCDGNPARGVTLIWLETEVEMARFNPAPPDKYADKTYADKTAVPAGAPTDQEDDLENGLEGTFPASDPVSAAQPAHAADLRKTPPSDAGERSATAWWGS